MRTLFGNGELTFEVSRNFEPGFLKPVARYVLWKLQQKWDDYNELAHATRFFHHALNYPGVWVDSHLAKTNEILSGSVFLLGGHIAPLEGRYKIADPEHSLLLKYFHVVEKGHGTGQLWLKDVIFPHYRKQGFRHIYLSSSHPKSFQFYTRLGSEVGRYASKSDNGIYEREGRCFRIDLTTV